MDIQPRLLLVFLRHLICRREIGKVPYLDLIMSFIQIQPQGMQYLQDVM